MTPGELQNKRHELIALPAETEWVEFKEPNADLDTEIFNKIYEVE